MEVLCDTYGLKYRDITQTLDFDIMVYDSSVIASPKTRTSTSIAVHWYDGTWIDSQTLLCRLKQNIKKNHPKVYRLLRGLCEDLI